MCQPDKHAQLDDSLEMLEDNFYITATHVIGQKFRMVELQSSGAHIVLREKFPDLDQKAQRVIEAIVNEDLTSNEEIAKRLSFPVALVNFFFDEMSSQGLIKRSQSIGGPDRIYEVSVRLKRMLR